MFLKKLTADHSKNKQVGKLKKLSYLKYFFSFPQLQHSHFGVFLLRHILVFRVNDLHVLFL